MLEPRDCGVTTTSTHKISFSIIDILDPNKFNSKRVNELSIVAEKFPVPNAERTSLESDSDAGGDFRVERTEAGKEKTQFKSEIQLIHQTCHSLHSFYICFHYMWQVLQNVRV